MYKVHEISQVFEINKKEIEDYHHERKKINTLKIVECFIENENMLIKRMMVEVIKEKGIWTPNRIMHGFSNKKCPFCEEHNKIHTPCQIFDGEADDIFLQIKNHPNYRIKAIYDFPESN